MDEKIAALWTISLTGANLLVFASQASQIRLTPEARTSIVELTAKLDSRDLWRLASSVSATPLPELSEWLVSMAINEKELSSEVTMNDPRYVEINEPHVGMYIRALAWVARSQNGDKSPLISTDNAKLTIDAAWNDRRFKKRVGPAIVTAYGLLGDGVPIVRYLDSSNPWLYETAQNIFEYWIGTETQRRSALSAIDERLGKRENLDGTTEVALGKLRHFVAYG